MKLRALAVVLVFCCACGNESSASMQSNSTQSNSTPSDAAIRLPAITGTIAGLTEGGLVLQVNGSHNLAVPANATSFQFSALVDLVLGETYIVTVFAEPTGLVPVVCTVANGEGSLMASRLVTNVSLTCKPPSGTVSTVAQNLNIYEVAADTQSSNLYVSSLTGAVSEVTQSGTVSSICTGCAGNEQQQIAIDEGGTLYTISSPASGASSVINQVLPSTGVVKLFAGVPAVQNGDGTYPTCVSADGPIATATFCGPEGIVLDASGNVYVSDSCAIRKISGGAVTTLAGAIGDCRFVDDVLAYNHTPLSVVLENATSGAGRFTSTGPLALDSSGTLYMPDDHTVRAISSAGVVYTFAGVAGVAGESDGFAETGATFGYMAGIAVDATGHVYVSEPNSGTIRKIGPYFYSFDPDVEGGLVETLGDPYWQVDADGPVDVATFGSPFGLALDSAGNLYIAEPAPSLRLRKIWQ